MGIRGLTTFIQNRSHLCMEKYELHDTNLVIDGNSVACQLYKWHTSSNDCFGGDYDKFGKTVNNFFDLLAQCNITPYVIFDGGYEKRKVTTIISRMKNKIKSANQLNCVTETSISVFPLFIRRAFEDVVICRAIKQVRCDFEGDTETANIAKALNCPILSFDSDYFIFDVFYIPFSTFEMSVKTRKLASTKNVYKYISCQIYRIDKFLKSFDGLQKSSLPILAVLLGNDYVKRGVFTMFYQNLKIQKCHGNQSDQQKRIKSLLIWLQNESIESALKKVLSRYKKAKRKAIMYKIKQAIKGYNCFDSKYLKYLEIDVHVDDRDEVKIDFEKVNDEIEEEPEPENDELELENEEDPVTEDLSSSDEEILFTEDEPELVKPSKFLEKFRLSQYPPSFMDILIQNKYYCVPQVENNALERSHKISYDILSAIHKILTSSSDDNLLCIGRKGIEQVGKDKIPLCSISIPKYDEIESLNDFDKKNYIFKILEFDDHFQNCLNLFPKDWHIFIMAINYYLKKSNTGWPLVYSLIMSKLILSCVDKKIGSFLRSSKAFFKKFGTYQIHPNTNTFNATNVQTALEYISKNDSIGCLKALISYFEMDYKMVNNYKLFDRDLVHSVSQFQSCLLHIVHLNELLDAPFINISIAECLSCTFIYNLCKNFSKRTNLDDYIKIMLKDSPSILYSFNFIVEKIKNCIKFEVNEVVVNKKRKKKKTKKEIFEEKREDIEINSDGEAQFDPNNKFALLRISCT